MLYLSHISKFVLFNGNGALPFWIAIVVWHFDLIRNGVLRVHRYHNHRSVEPDMKLVGLNLVEWIGDQPM